MTPVLSRIAIVLTCVAACEHVDSTGEDVVPRIGPGISASLEHTALSSDSRERMEPPPRDPRQVRRENWRNWLASLQPHQQYAVGQVCRWQEMHPCGTLLRIAGQPPLVDPRPKLLTAFEQSQRSTANQYCAEMRPTVCHTPLVVAFEGQAIAFTDHLPTSTTPWLALDRDGDGAITSRTELFGDATVLPSGRTADNGFTALAALDDNADGVIDHRDAAFARLLLWADRDGDERSSAGELRAASETLVSIPLANARDVRCTADDDCEGERGAFVWRDEKNGLRTGAVVDVYLPSR
jgi:hypothetical protein